MVILVHWSVLPKCVAGRILELSLGQKIVKRPLIHWTMINNIWSGMSIVELTFEVAN